MNVKFRFLILVLLTVGIIGGAISCDTKNWTQKLLYNKARNLHDHGKIDEAIEVYQKVLESDGNNSAVIYDLGVAYADKQDSNSAKKQVAELKKLGRQDLAEVLSTVIRDGNAHRVQKRLKKEFEENQ